MRIVSDPPSTAVVHDDVPFEADEFGVFDVPHDVGLALLRYPDWSLAADLPDVDDVDEGSEGPGLDSSDTAKEQGQGGDDEDNAGDDDASKDPGSDDEPDLDGMDKAALLAYAESIGVEVSKSWGERRLRKTIAGA